MNTIFLSKNDQEQQTSLFMTSSFSRNTLALQNNQRQEKSYKKTTILFLLLAISLIIGYLYYAEHQNRTLRQRISFLTNVQSHNYQQDRNKEKTSQVSKKYDTLYNRPKKEVIEVPFTFGLFEDGQAKVTITKKNDIINTKEQRQNTQPDRQNNQFLQILKKLRPKNVNISSIQNKLKNESSKQFIIPKKVWVYSENYKHQSFYIKKCLQNSRRFANKSGFTFTVVDNANLNDFLPQQRVAKIKYTLSRLNKQSIHNPSSGDEGIISSVTKELILLEILHHNGGIIMDKNVVLTQDFSWLTNIDNNQYVNAGNSAFSAKYVGFHNVNFVTPQEKNHQIGISHRYISRYIGLESFFLAGVPKGSFLQTILEIIHIMLLSPQNSKETVNDLRLTPSVTNLYIVSNVFPIACRIVLKQLQDIESQGILAIDYYGIKSINSLLFPRKIGHYFEYSFDQKIYKNLASYELSELQETVGPLRYMALLPFQSYIDERLRVLSTNKINQEMQLLHPQSFLAKYLFFNSEKVQFQTEIQTQNINKTEEIWEDLPNIIWIERDQQNKKTSLLSQLCYQNIGRHAHSANFEVREVTSQTLEKWVNFEYWNLLKTLQNNAKIQIFKKTKMEIAKLNILIQYGGIWISDNFFALQSFEWIRQIANYPSQAVFNRFGNLPRVLMYFHPHYGQPFEWTYNSDPNTKFMWNIAFDGNFIASEPNQGLLKDWLQQYLKFLTRPYEDSLNEMKTITIDRERWTSIEYVYFSFLDSIKIAMGKKEKEFQKLASKGQYWGPKTAPEYYQVWGINGAQGPWKFDATFASWTKSNALIWRYPKQYTQGILGKVHKIAKLYHVNSNKLQEILSKLISPLSDQIDLQSFFYIHLYEPVQANITKKDGKILFV